MIYIKNNSAAQALLIPRTGLESEGDAATLTLTSTLGAQSVLSYAVDAVEVEGAYLSIKAALADTEIPVGEYRYAVVQDSEVVAEGLAVVGEYTRLDDSSEGSSIPSFNFEQI